MEKTYVSYKPFYRHPKGKIIEASTYTCIDYSKEEIECSIETDEAINYIRENASSNCIRSFICDISYYVDSRYRVDKSLPNMPPLKDSLKDIYKVTIHIEKEESDGYLVESRSFTVYYPDFLKDLKILNSETLITDNFKQIKLT